MFRAVNLCCGLVLLAVASISGASIRTIYPEVLWTNVNGGWQISFSPDGELIGALGPVTYQILDGEYISKRDVNFYSTASGKLAWSFPLPTAEHEARWLRFAPDGKHVAVVDYADRTFLAMHRARDGAVRWIVNRGTSARAAFNDLFFLPDGKTLLTLSFRDQDAELWQWKHGALIAAWDTTKESVGSQAGALSPDGKILVTGGNLWNAELKVWDLPSRTLMRSLPPVNVLHSEFAFGYCFSFSPDGEHLVVGHFGGDDFYIPDLGFMPLPVIRRWRVRDWALEWERVERYSLQNPVVHSPNGRYFGTAQEFRRAEDGEPALWLPNGMIDLQFSPDGRRMAYILSGGVLVMAKTPHELAE